MYNLFVGFFDFLKKKKIYEGDVVDLKESYRVSEKQSYDNVPTVYYHILLHGTDLKVGSIDLRLTIEGDMYYYGHIGYNIIRSFRGNNYAYYACLVLFKIAKEEFGMNELILTCSPDNIASYKTLKKLNGELIELVKVPKNHRLYALGETSKYIFRYKISL